MSLQIELYSESSDKKHFIEEFTKFPHLLFKENEKVKKLPLELEGMYFKLYPLVHDFLLIKVEGKLVFRSMVCLTPFKDLLYFGLLDFDYKHSQIDSVLEAFKGFTKNWNKDKGASKLIGPINFSTWLPYRLLSSNDGGPQYSFEPDRPIEYCTLLKKHGFTTNQLFSSKGHEKLVDLENALEKYFTEAIRLGFRFEYFPNVLTEEDLKDLHRLSLNIFADNYLATPIDFETFQNLYMAQSLKEDQTYSNFILSPSGEKVGFIVSFLENNSLVLKTIGVDKKFRGYGLSSAAMYYSLAKGSSAGISQVVAAMVKEGAQSETYCKELRLLWTHLYEILEHPL